MSIPSALDSIDAARSTSDLEEYSRSVKLLENALLEVHSHYWTFETVPGYFKQSLDSTDDSKFDYLKEHFGILKPWCQIVADLDSLNGKSKNTQYKVLFLARHGQGVHNKAHSKYGNEAWDDYWLKLNGDGELVWGPDPLLTALGESQAEDNLRQWKEELALEPRILPTRWYVSPFTRAIDTLNITWRDLVDLPKAKVVAYESLRETMGVHTCDKRGTRSTLQEKYGLWLDIEKDMPEDDIYWRADYRETVAEQAVRMNDSFQKIFNESNESVVSITSHSGSIRAQLLVAGHRAFSVGTGGMIPVLVKATKHLT